MTPKQKETVMNGTRQHPPAPKGSNAKSICIVFYDAKGLDHHEYLPRNQRVKCVLRGSTKKLQG